MRTYSQQKAGLTRAINSHRYDRVLAECERVLTEWDELPYGWPDDWHRWNIALGDAWNHERGRYLVGHVSTLPEFLDLSALNARRLGLSS